MAKKGPKPLTELQRFMRHVNTSDFSLCWLWKGAVDSSGTGRFSISVRPQRMIAAYIVAGRLFSIDVPSPPTDVICGHRLCVNPKHRTPLRMNEYERRISKKIRRIIHRQRHKNTAKFRNQRNARLVSYRRNNKQKTRARVILQRAVASGKVTVPKKCSACSRVLSLQGHHENYTKPLSVVWLCEPCHKKIHGLSRIECEDVMCLQAKKLFHGRRHARQHDPLLKKWLREQQSH